LFFGDESQEYKEWLKNLPTETKWKRGDRVQIIYKTRFNGNNAASI
jgi:hypothetical protein